MSFADVNVNRADYFYQLGRKDEQDRIIELLETEVIVNFDDYSDEDEWAFKKAIKLIKGEQRSE